ncbi:hypothetical protein D3C86_2192450 [compost metagenome]
MSPDADAVLQLLKRIFLLLKRQLNVLRLFHRPRNSAGQLAPNAELSRLSLVKNRLLDDCLK